MITKEYFGEGKNIEFKRQIPKAHERFLKDIIAFSNSSGGKVILGIEDGTNEVYGIGEQSPFEISDAISTMVSDACTPQINPDIFFKTIEDKTVLVIDVAPGKYRPYYLASKGKEATTYIRINGTSRPADERKIKELELEGQRISYDSMRCIGYDFDENKALALCKEMTRIATDACRTEEAKAEVKDMTLEKLEDFGILVKEGRTYYPTHAFELLADNKKFYAKIQCALFKGITRDRFVDQKEFGGPIYEQIEAANLFVLRHINMGAEIDGVYRNDIYELPVAAVREMIANAVVHRSYLDDSSIQVSIFDDRIEVLSPGMLYGGVDLETVKRGKSRCRNTAIARAFSYMHVVEAWGTGIPRMISRCKEYGLREPVFEELGDGFMVTMYRKKVDERLAIGEGNLAIEDEKLAIGDGKLAIEDGKLAIEQLKLAIEKQNFKEITKNNILQVYEAIAENQVFGSSEVAEILNCSSANARLLLAKLRKMKVVYEVKGMGKGKYKFI